MLAIRPALPSSRPSTRIASTPWARRYSATASISARFGRLETVSKATSRASSSIAADSPPRSGENALTARLLADHCQELASRGSVFAECAKHPTGCHHHARFVHTAGSHALVRRLDDHRYSLGLKNVIN